MKYLKECGKCSLMKKNNKLYLQNLEEEKDLLYSNLEELTIEGVTDVLNKRGDHPKAVLLFTVCLHHFLGSNLKYIYRKLEERFPDICFIRCYMDPIMQKHSLTPDQKLRKAMYDPLPVCEADEKTVSVLGSDFVAACDSFRLGGSMFKKC